jgi:tRNA (guanine37-N1)-methyltransferase
MSDHESAFSDSFWERGLSAPSYTRPPEFRGHTVPEVLLSGDHKRIAEWRAREGERLTNDRRARGGKGESGSTGGQGGGGEG